MFSWRSGCLFFALIHGGFSGEMHCNISMSPLTLAQPRQHLFELAVALMRYELSFLIGWGLIFSRAKK